MSAPENSTRHQFTASQIAAKLGVSSRTVRFKLQGLAPTGKVFVRGQETDAWAFEDLPLATREQLERNARRGGYRSVRDYCESPARREWSPPVPLSQISESQIARAELLRRAFAATFERRLHDTSLSEEEFARLGIADYCHEMDLARKRKGASLSARQWRRLFDLVIERDAGAENFSRLELYLPEKIARRANAAITAEPRGEFGFILDYMRDLFRDPLRPTPEEQSAFWYTVCKVFCSLVDADKSESKIRRRLLKFLWQSVPNSADWLAVSPNALRVNLGRKLVLYRACNGDPADGRSETRS